MKNVLLAILILVVIAAAAVVTCPDKEAHKEALENVINEVISDDMEGEPADLTLLGNSIVSGLSGFVLNSALDVENHFVYSIGVFNYDESQVVSVGVFNHVFMPGKDKVRAIINL